jgi:CBS domain-containing protein
MPETNDPGRATQNIGAIAERLRQFSPFEQMAAADLTFLVEHSRLAFYAAGEEILTPAHGDVDRLYVIKQGQVRGERERIRGSAQENVFLLGMGECFPLGALLGERPTRTVHRALTDTFCLELDREHFAVLFERSPPFREFFIRRVSSLLERVSRQTQSSAAEHLGAQTLLNAPLAQVIQRAPVSCGPDISIREASRIMHSRKVGSIVVCGDDHRPLGIFSLHDLLAVMADGEQDFEQPIATVMTPEPIALPPTAFAFDAALIMTRHRIGHVCVVDRGRLTGVVSERDLFALQRVDLVHLTRFIEKADSIETLAALRGQIARLIDALLAHGAAAPQVTHIITLLNDHTTTRVIELCRTEHGDPELAFTWLAFGSEGRREQTLVTDQDNGIYFEPPPGTSVEQARQRLLPLARRINHALARLGFPLCKGNVMASNPELCLSGPEWRQAFSQLIAAATPQNLLRSGIYFDLRPTYGKSAAAQAMFARVADQAAVNGIFLRMLAADALRYRPPLGLIRDFVVTRDEANQPTLDLKLAGLTPFVAGTRVLALAHGITASNTLERLQVLADRQAISARDAEVWSEAFGLIQLIRLRHHQAQAHEGRPLSNRIDPQELNQLDRRILKEAFREARRLQRRLELDYQL